ncbi:hypothetical protein Q5752_003840 [Cryptotrichosporon argae]
MPSSPVGDDSSAEGSAETYRCAQCGKRYARRDYLARHMLNLPGSPLPEGLFEHLASPAAHDDSAALDGGLDVTLVPTFASTPDWSALATDRQELGQLGQTRGELDLGFAAIDSGDGRNSTHQVDSVDDFLSWLLITPQSLSSVDLGPTTFGVPHVSPTVGFGMDRVTPIAPLEISHDASHVARAPHLQSVLVEPFASDEQWHMPPPCPVLDAAVRTEMLDMFDDAFKSDLLSAGFTLDHMNLYLEMYFLYFAPLYQVIHRPSLGHRRLPPDLLLTMICIGTAFDEDKTAFRMASRVHKKLRSRILEAIEEEPRASITSLQTILLINQFSRSFCSLKEHDVAHIFHSPAIIMARLRGVFEPNFARVPNGNNPLARWLEWVREEERKRVGWFAFVMDTENAAMFRHYLMVHSFSVHIEYPADEYIWDAADPVAWSRAVAAAPNSPTFRNSLRQIVSRGTIPPNTNEAAMWILLHGLLSVSWTLLWRDLGDLSFVVQSKIPHWKDSLRRAFESWRDEVTRLFARQTLAGKDGVDSHIYWAGIPFAHLDIAGRPISPGEWKAAAHYVDTWARSQDGAQSCIAAIELVIWAYSSILEGADRLVAPYIVPLASLSADPSVKIEPSLARRDALAYLSGMAGCHNPADLPNVKRKNKCAGIIAYTAHLAGMLGRGVMDESRKVLLGLLTEHL